MNSHSRKAFELGKAASYASAIINIAEGVTKALAQGGIFGPVLAGTIVAAGAVQLNLSARSSSAAAGRRALRPLSRRAARRRRSRRAGTRRRA